jgi:hypothetical protein
VRNATRDPRNQRGRNKREQGGNQAQGTEKRERRKGGKERQRKAPSRQGGGASVRNARRDPHSQRAATLEQRAHGKLRTQRPHEPQRRPAQAERREEKVGSKGGRSKQLDSASGCAGNLRKATPPLQELTASL